MKQQRMISVKTNVQNVTFLKFCNNAIAKVSSSKIKGGDDDFVVTEDCIDM